MREVSVFRLCGSVGSTEGLSTCDSPERSRAFMVCVLGYLGEGENESLFATDSLESTIKYISEFSPSPNFYFEKYLTICFFFLNEL